ncbi:MAG: signal peptidase II [Oscillospiraceae bacterium]|nr:signal peptidase II [Oscillospiraceae bacterium]
MIYLLIALFCICLDQLTKYLVTAGLEWGQHTHLIPGLLGLTRIKNTGMAWSLLSASQFRWVLAAVSVAVSIVIIVILLRNKLTKWENFALALVLGGAIGNAVDRIMLGYVVDMIETEFISFPIFNVADSFITVGAIIFVILYGIRSIKEEREKKNAAMPELRRLRESRERAEEEKDDDADGKL